MAKTIQKISLLSDYVFLKKLKGKWGVVFSFNCSEFLILPINLGESLYAYEEGELILLSLPDYSKRISVKVFNIINTIEWQIPILDNLCLWFERRQSAEYILFLLESLYLKMQEGEPNLYPLYERIEVLNLLIKQLKERPTPFLNNSDLKNLPLDKIHLVPGHDKSNECYTIKIRDIEVDFNDEFYGGGDLEKTRLQLESFVSNGICKIIFAEECEENELVINQLYPELVEVDKINESDLWENIVKVKYIPFYSKYAPILTGFGKKMLTIKNIYEGLLLRTLYFPLDFDPYFYERPSRKDGYNLAKSFLIEDYLRRGCNINLLEEKTNNLIDRVIWIDPDYDVCFWERLNDEAPFGVINDTIDDLSVSKDGKPITIEGFSEWAIEIQEIIIKSETGEKYEKDWIDYHTRGLQFAHELRENMRDNIDLWYVAPYEDKSGVLPNPILILKGFNDEIVNL